MKLKPILICLFIIFALIAVYYPVTNYDFINYDDYEYVVENPFVNKGLTGNGVKRAIFSSYASNWHPLTWLSHMLDIDLFGFDAGGHHLSNLLLHMLNSLLLFFLFYRTTGQIIPSGIVAILFALHPLNIESVAWIAQRKNLLCTFFLINTLLFYYYYTKNLKFSYYLISLFLFWLGLMSKPMLITLPFLLIVFDYWPLNRIETDDNRNLIETVKGSYSILIEKIPFFVLSGILASVTLLAQKAAIGTETGYPLIMRISNALVSYGSYVWKMVFPFNLAVPYPYPEKISLVPLGIAIGFLSVITLIAVYNAKTKKFVFFGWVWYLITLIPTIGIVQVGVQAMADRYTYIPLIGLFVIISWSLYHLSRKNFLGKIVLYASVVFAINYLFITTHSQLKFWQNSTSLFRHAVEVTDNNYVAHNNLGQALHEKGMEMEAMRHYKRAIGIKPDFAIAYLNLGVAHAALHEYEKALQNYFSAVKFNPNNTEALCNIGNAYLRQGELKSAYKYYRQALESNPHTYSAYNGIGAVLVKQGQMDKAAACFEKALSINPFDQTAKHNLNAVIQHQKTNP